MALRNNFSLFKSAATTTRSAARFKRPSGSFSYTFLFLLTFANRLAKIREKGGSAMSREQVIEVLQEMVKRGELLIFDEQSSELHNRVVGVSANGPKCIQIILKEGK